MSLDDIADEITRRDGKRDVTAEREAAARRRATADEMNHAQDVAEGIWPPRPAPTVDVADDVRARLSTRIDEEIFEAVSTPRKSFPEILCELVGLDPNRVTALTVSCPGPNEPTVVVAELIVKPYEVSADGDMKTEMTRWTVVPADDEGSS